MVFIMSLFITFEGTEGSGKTTQIQRLARFLTERGQEVVLTREPGGCTISDAIRAILLDNAHREMDENAELLLYAAARAQHVAQVLRPALAAGKTVLCDRFTDATLAYQGWGRKLPLERIRALNAMATGGLTPDITLLLDLPVEKGLKRALSRIASSSGPREDRFERERLEFHSEVQRGYRSLASDEPGRFRLIDADRSPEEVERQIEQCVLQSLESRPHAL